MSYLQAGPSGGYGHASPLQDTRQYAGTKTEVVEASPAQTLATSSTVSRSCRSSSRTPSLLRGYLAYRPRTWQGRRHLPVAHALTSQYRRTTARSE